MSIVTQAISPLEERYRICYQNDIFVKLGQRFCNLIVIVYEFSDVCYQKFLHRNFVNFQEILINHDKGVN